MPLHEADGRAEREQSLDVRRGAAEVGLEADAGSRRSFPHTAEQVEGAVHVRAALHVDPHHAAERVGALDESQQVAVARLEPEVEAELGELDGDRRVEAVRLDPVHEIQVVPGYLPGLVEGGEVLAEMGQDGPRAVHLLLLARRRERLVQRLARHEPRDRSSNEGIAHGPLAKPRAPGAGEQDAAHDGHAGLLGTGLIPTIAGRRWSHPHAKRPFDARETARCTRGGVSRVLEHVASAGAAPPSDDREEGRGCSLARL